MTREEWKRRILGSRIDIDQAADDLLSHYELYRERSASCHSPTRRCEMAETL